MAPETWNHCGNVPAPEITSHKGGVRYNIFLGWNTGTSSVENQDSSATPNTSGMQ
jgi:hypothetical protein